MRTSHEKEAKLQKINSVATCRTQPISSCKNADTFPGVSAPSDLNRTSEGPVTCGVPSSKVAEAMISSVIYQFILNCSLKTDYSKGRNRAFGPLWNEVLKSLVQDIGFVSNNSELQYCTHQKQVS